MACCEESAAKQLSESKTSADMAVVFSALSNPARIDILRHIAQHRHCGCKEITEVLPLAQSLLCDQQAVLG